MRVARASLGRDRAGGLLGVCSACLLAASLRWAHHWSDVADTIVAAWACATVGALVLSITALRAASVSRWFARLGLSLGMFSVLALAVAGLLYAAGIDAAGACGGG
jgi:hypothetical protein